MQQHRNSYPRDQETQKAAFSMTVAQK